jgi:hypothetical protein
MVNGRTLASVSASLAVIAAIVAANLWRELHAERELAAALQTRMAGSAGHALDHLPAEGSGVASAVPGANARGATTVVPPADAAMVQDAPGSGQQLPMAVRDPVARLAELRSSLEEGYPGLVEALQLTDQEADQLFGMLAEARLVLEAEATIFESESVDLVAAAQVSRNRQVRQREQVAAMKALLGETRYAQWQAYQQTQSVRLQARNYATALANAGAPLDSAQTNNITMAMIEEQERRQRDNPAQPQIQVQARPSLERQQQESRQRVLEAASRHLTAQQLGLLRRQIEQQDAIERDAARARERFWPEPQH